MDIAVVVKVVLQELVDQGSQELGQRFVEKKDDGELENSWFFGSHEGGAVEEQIGDVLVPASHGLH